MALTFICPNKDPLPWIKALKALDPGLDIRIWPDDHPREEIDLALTWAHPAGVLAQYPQLKCISSMGAGVDHLLSDPDLPEKVPLVRIVDQNLVRDMAEYLTLCVLFYFRQFDGYQDSQSQKKWQPLAAGQKKEFPVGIMGMGQLGTAAARAITTLGFPVAGWKNSPGTVSDIQIFTGKSELNAFLCRTRILICLLPLTAETFDILDLSLFSQLNKEFSPPGKGILINAARGGHLKEEDLIPAFDRGFLSGACLDVFKTEPLPCDHPFWEHPGIRITPHVSSLTRPESVAPQIVENIRRIAADRSLLNPVSRAKGY